MATLNRSETQTIRDVQSALDYVLRNGYDPKKKEDAEVGKLIQTSKDALRGIAIKKGYHSP